MTSIETVNGKTGMELLSCTEAVGEEGETIPLRVYMEN